MADTNFLEADTMVVYDTSGLTGTHAALNGAGFTNRLKVLKIYNASDTDITISYDAGVTDHDFIPVGSTMILDCQANNDSVSGGGGRWHIKKSQVLYGKGTAGIGNLYIIGYF